MAEYRIEELAAETGTTVRSLQSYRNRGLLPPPRRQGRIALYSDAHVERLALIADLIDRGYSLNAIGELLSGLGRGEGISDLLGVERAASTPEPALPIVVSRRDLNPYFGEGDDTTLEQAERIGVLAPVGDADPLDRAYEIVNAPLLQAGAELVAAGIPLDAVIAEGLSVRDDIDRVAQRFVQLIVHHLVEGAVGAPTSERSLTELVQRLRPLAEIVVTAQLAPAIERHAHEQLDIQLRRLMQGD